MTLHRPHAPHASPLSAAHEAPVICFSHLRWDFVLQRPQHLMMRLARTRSVWFWEEPIPTDHHLPYLEFHAFEGTTVQAIRPRIPAAADPANHLRILRMLCDQFLQVTGISIPILWFYTPQMWPIARHINNTAVVYDCMDELSAFDQADPALPKRERELMAVADVVFTGGQSLYAAKRHLHDNIHAFPSSVDSAHFLRARCGLPEPQDQTAIPRPRLGYYGVIDERLDLSLIRDLARGRPDWQIVMVGPVVKIDPARLPHAPNIHWLGQKSYAELPDYLSGWDVALMPFAINAATRHISPTKTPEYLAGGKQVVSTSVPDVVRQYGGVAAVRIADTPAAFIAACEAQLVTNGARDRWLPEVDALLAHESWDGTYARMQEIIAASAMLSAAPAVAARAPTANGARRFMK